MSDERLREAERKWKESGSVDDEARYLLERVRVGDLTQERLELAAYCGHEGAKSAGGCKSAELSVVALLKGLKSAVDRPALARALGEVAHAALNLPHLELEPTLRARCVALIERVRLGIDERSGLVDPTLERDADVLFEQSDPTDPLAFACVSVATGPVFYSLGRVDDDFSIEYFSDRLAALRLDPGRLGASLVRALHLLE